MTKRTLSGFELAAALFFASGFSSLIYQVVWNRLFVFLFGSTTFATASVLSVFMGGLAIGSYIAGRMTEKVRRPLLWYGILEGVIGIWALFVPGIIDWSVPIYKALWLHNSPTVMAISLQRFALAAGSIIVPTVCMGATLPLLSRFVSNNPNTIGLRVGSLYGINTLGAVFGAALSGFALLPSFGLSHTIYIAVAINFFLLLAVIWASRKLETGNATSSPDASAAVAGSAVSADGIAPAAAASESVVESQTSNAASGGRDPRFSWATKALIAIFGVSGGLSMLYEVGWTKALVFVVGSSTYAFTCMLATFLIGIFLGSLWCAKHIDKRKDPILVFAVLEIAVAGFALLGLWLYNFMPSVSLALGDLAKISPESALLLKFTTCALIFVPLTLGLGATFPAIVKACAPDLATVGRSVGVIYSANTCGAIIGAFVAGFFLVPSLGVERMLVLACVGNLVLGALALLLDPTAGKLRVPLLIGVGVAAVVAWVVPVWDPVALLLTQPMRRAKGNHLAMAVAMLDERTRKRVLGDIKVIYFKDGISSNVGVIEYDNPRHRSIITNGNIDGGDKGDMATQLMVGVNPFFCRPDLKDIAVVGWGTGVTTGGVTLFPVKSISSIELEEKVIEASKLFHHINHKPEEDPRHKVVINDGRNFLLMSDQKFDMISSEPSNQWQAGVCNLFTKEYFEICKRRLNPNGMLCFWLQTAEISPDNIKGVIATALSVYKHVVVTMAGDQADLMVLVSDDPIKFDYPAIQRAYQDPAIKADMIRVGLPTPEAMLSCILGGDKKFHELTASSWINTDDYNFLEYSVCKTYESFNYLDVNRKMLTGGVWNPADEVNFGNLSPLDRCRTATTVAMRCLRFDRLAAAENWANYGLAQLKSGGVKDVDAESTALSILARAEFLGGNVKQATAHLREAEALKPDNVEVLLTKSSIEPATAIPGLQAALRLKPDNEVVRYRLCFALAGWNPSARGDEYTLHGPAVKEPKQVLALLEPVMNDKHFTDEYPLTVYLAALCAYKAGDIGRCEELLKKYEAMAPDSAAAKRAIGCVSWMNGNQIKGAGYWQQSLSEGRTKAQDDRKSADKLLSEGDKQSAYKSARLALSQYPGDPDSIELLAQFKDSQPEVAEVQKDLELTQATRAAENATIEKSNAEGQSFARVVELFAAVYLLWLVMRKKKETEPPAAASPASESKVSEQT